MTLEPQSIWNIHLAHGISDALIIAPVLFYLGFLVWGRGSNKATSWLLIAGGGYWATGFAALAHGVLSSDLLPINDDIVHLAPSSWFAERAHHALSMVAAWLVYYSGGFSYGTRAFKQGILVGGAIVGIVFVVLALILVPSMYIPGAIFPRPLDAALIPIFTFLVFAWRHNAVMRSAMAFAVVTQLCMAMAQQSVSGDFVGHYLFQFSHGIKLIEYVTPIILLRRA